MPKAYWVSTYTSVTEPNAVAEYTKLALPIMEGNCRILARGMPATVYEAGLNERLAVVEFPSVEAAIKLYESSLYQRAVKVLAGGAVREIRIIEAAD